jgi:hypothetical protein
LGGGADPTANKDGVADTKDIKELEKKNKEVRELSTKFPEAQDCKALVEQLEAQLLEARPPTTVQTSALQKELEDCEQAIEDAEKKVEQEKDRITKQLQEVRKQQVQICTTILQKEARAKAIVAQLAERAAAAPAATSAPAPAQSAPQMQIAHVPAFLSNTKAELDVACATGALLTDPTKQKLKRLSDNWNLFEEIGALLVDARTAVNNEISYAAGVTSTDMPPTPGLALSGFGPQQAAGAVGQQQPTHHAVLEPPVPPPLLVPKGFVNSVPPTDSDDLFDLDGNDDLMSEKAGGGALARECMWEDKIDSFQEVMALARASAAQTQAADEASAAGGEKKP